MAKLANGFGSTDGGATWVPLAVDTHGNTRIVRPLAPVAPAHTASGTNADVVITFPGAAGTYNVLSGIAWSYNSAPTGGSVQIVDSSQGTVFSEDVIASGPGSVNFNPPLASTQGGSFTITLTAGGVAVIGKLNILGHWTTDQIPDGVTWFPAPI
jgi:hypothetical protein